MDNISYNISNTITKLYNKQGFYEKYGIDFIIAILIIFIFLSSSSYFHIINHLPQIRNEWNKNPDKQCHPLYIPFTGLIEPTKNPMNMRDYLDSATDAFVTCTHKLLSTLEKDAMMPIHYMMNIMHETFNQIIQSLNDIRKKFDNLKKASENLGTNVSKQKVHQSIFITKILNIFRNMTGLFAGIMMTALDFFLGSMNLAGTIMKIWKQILQAALDIITGIVAVLSISALWLGPEVLAAAVIVEAAVTVGMEETMHLTDVLFKDITTLHAPGPINPGTGYTTGVPKPACFGKDTKIQMHDKTYKIISDITLGNILYDGSVVTGTMLMSSHEQSIYKLDNIIVTGLHRVYHPTLGLIKILDHPDSHEITDYKNDLYCLNTTTKIIKINNYTFTDWDDLDNNEIDIISKNSGLLPKHYENKDIHKYMDNGLDGNTLIEMEIGTHQALKTIKINDILRFGGRVLGIIKIDPTNILNINEYKINNTILKCTSNIEIDNENFGHINTNILKGKPIKIKECLYQLITEEGIFVVNNLKIFDYNKGIEKYLENNQFDSQNNYQ
jgi:hypothetical protein